MEPIPTNNKDDNKDDLGDNMEGGEPSPAESVDIDQIADDIISEAPDAQEHTIQQHSEKEKQKVSEHADLVDRDGNHFNPELHRTDKNGAPVLSPKNKLIKKPGRKTGTKINKESVIGTGNKDALAVDKRAIVRTSGKHAANLMIAMGVTFGGDEWQPIKNDEYGIDEKLGLETAFGDYFEAKGWEDIPPGWALVLVVGGYCAPRFTMPKTQARASGVFGKIKKWWVNRKLKKHGLSVEVDKNNKSDKDGKVER